MKIFLRLENIYNSVLNYKKSPEAIRISSIKNDQIKRQLKFICSQIDCDFRCKTSTDSSKILQFQSAPPKSVENEHIELIKSLLQCSWTYLLDVLTGFILNTNIDNLEEILFFDVEQNENFDIDNDLITDISFKLVAFKSCLDSLYMIIRIVSDLKSMEKELDQLIFIMSGDYFSSSQSFKEDFSKRVSLNQLICFDFLLYSKLVTYYIFKNKLKLFLICDLFFKVVK